MRIRVHNVRDASGADGGRLRLGYRDEHGAATIVAIGTFFVAIVVGPLIDYLGRKRSLIITALGTGLSSGLTPAGFAAPFLALVRSVSGLGYAEQAINATYLNEVYGTRKNRALVYSLVQGGWPIGVLLASAFTA